jgi:ribulose-5-phosphate 4-epimerase/fuculose-1-phosphate aldolase
VHEIDEARRTVAQACRILAVHGLAEDILGHVSIRVGTDELLIRCRGPAERGLAFTTPEDVHIVPLNGDPAATLPDGFAAPSELPIHTMLLRTRPGVQAVVHAHAPAVVGADLAGLALVPIIGAYNIPAMRLSLAGVPVYPRSVLIRRDELATQMAAAMADATVCILRGHGVVTTGNTVAEAVLRALSLESLARVTLSVAQAGGHPAAIPREDVAELPDLGAALNEHYLWQHQLARLEHAGLNL